MSRDPLPRLLPLPAWLRTPPARWNEEMNPRSALALLVGGMPERTADDVVATYLANSTRTDIARVVRRARAIRKRDGGIESVTFFERD